MRIKNTIIITDDNSEITTSGVDDSSGFSGNLVFNRAQLPASLVEQLDRVVGQIMPRQRRRAWPSR